jgi:hypothetical protein
MKISGLNAPTPMVWEIAEGSEEAVVLNFMERYLR